MGLSNVTGASSILQPGVCTSSTRPASPYDGQVIYETDTDKVAVYDSSSWIYKTGTSHVAPALVLVSSTTIGTAVSTVTVSNAFSSTYDNYKILINGGATSAASRLQVQLGATAVGYYSGNHRITYTGAVLSTTSDINDDAFKFGGWGYPDGINLSAELHSPNLAKFTVFSASGAQMATTGQSFVYNGWLNNTTQYTDFTIVTSGGTLTGGTIQVYGYTKG